MRAGLSPPAPHLRNPVRRDQAPRQTRRSREQDCSHRSNHRGIRATVSTARDPPLERSASSNPPANRQKNHSMEGVFTQPGSYPAVMPREVALSFFRSQGFTLVDSFILQMPPGTTELLVFKRFVTS